MMETQFNLNPIEPFLYAAALDPEGSGLRRQEIMPGTETPVVTSSVQDTESFSEKTDKAVKSATEARENGRQLPQWATALSERALKKLGLKECETCENRKYQDGSDDPGVSYKSAARISPEAATVKVRAHEHEHVVRNQAKAEREDKEVLFQTVRIFTNICPECGRVYVSGGETRTVTKGKADQEIRPGSQVDFKV